jgi:spoIIIJ-associated protein
MVDEAGPDGVLEELEHQADAVADFMEELLDRMGIDAIAEPVPRGDSMYVDIVDVADEDLALLIGREGQTLDAIQELVRMVVGRQLDARIRVVVDVGGVRKKREDDLASMGREAAERAVDSGDEIELEPMNAYERKIVHDAVATVEGAESVSRGEDPNRFVVVHRV